MKKNTYWLIWKIYPPFIKVMFLSLFSYTEYQPRYLHPKCSQLVPDPHIWYQDLKLDGILTPSPHYGYETRQPRKVNAAASKQLVASIHLKSSKMIMWIIIIRAKLYCHWSITFIEIALGQSNLYKSFQLTNIVIWAYWIFQ